MVLILLWCDSVCLVLWLKFVIMFNILFGKFVFFVSFVRWIVLSGDFLDGFRIMLFFVVSVGLSF